MKLNWKALAGILLAAVAMFIAVNVLYGDSYKLLSGDVINIRQLRQSGQSFVSSGN